MVHAPATAQATAFSTSDDDDDDDDRDAVPFASGGAPVRRTPLPAIPTIPRNAFGRPEDEITSDFQIVEDADDAEPVGSPPSLRLEPDAVAAAWRPLIDDDVAPNPEAEPLLDSLRKTRVDTVPGAKLEGSGFPPSSGDGHGGGRPGLN
jgi:hypothetical protein